MTSVSAKYKMAGMLAALLAAVPMGAQAMLVTIITPVAPPAASGSCANTSMTDGLEGEIVEAQAQYWAYLMKQPGFASSQTDLPGTEITNPDIKTFFYLRLRFWLRQEATPRPSPEALVKLNDVSQAIRMMTGLCG